MEPGRSDYTKFNPKRKSICNHKDTLAEWLRRRPAKPVGSAREGSNPSGVVYLRFSRVSASNVNWLLAHRSSSCECKGRLTTSNMIENANELAVWSSGMILASGARGPGFDPRNGPVSLRIAISNALIILSAMGFEPMRSDLQWILSPPP